MCIRVNIRRAEKLRLVKIYGLNRYGIVPQDYILKSNEGNGVILEEKERIINKKDVIEG